MLVPTTRPCWPSTPTQQRDCAQIPATLGAVSYLAGSSYSGCEHFSDSGPRRADAERQHLVRQGLKSQGRCSCPQGQEAGKPGQQGQGPPVISTHPRRAI